MLDLLGQRARPGHDGPPACLTSVVQNACREKSADFPGETTESCPNGYETRHVGRDMIRTMFTLRDLLERGYGMRAQRIVEGALLVGSFVFDDLRPAYVAFALLVLQVLSPLAAPVALAWVMVDRSVPPDRLGNLYYDSVGG